MLQRVHENEEMEDRLGSLQADLELFVEGQSIDPKYLFCFILLGRLCGKSEV